MSTTVGGKSGEPGRVPASTLSELRLGMYGELVGNDVGYGRYFEANRLGRSHVHWVQGFTLVAANATALAAATQLVVGIVNPLGSNKAAIITKVETQSRSGTPGGPLYLTAGLSAAAITTASAGTMTNTSNFQASISTIRPYHNVALTGFVNAGQALNAPIGGQFAAALAASAGQLVWAYEPAGSIIIPPGGVCGITCTAAGTTHIIDAALWFVEVDYPTL